MIAPTVEFPRAQFQKLAQGLRDAKRMTSPEIIKQQFRLTIRDCVAATPPFDTPGFGRFGHEVSLKAHQLIGRKATRRDIGKVFTAFDSMPVARGRNRLAATLRRYAAAGNVAGIVAILKNANIPFAEVVSNAASLPFLHDARRGSRGRVRNGRRPRVIVLDGKALRDYTDEEVSHVGRAKGGWAQLATIAGLALPGWITQHAGEPFLYQANEDPDHPSITFGNLVEFVDDFAELRILPLVFENRITSMRTELDRVIEGNARRELAKVKG